MPETPKPIEAETVTTPSGHQVQMSPDMYPVSGNFQHLDTDKYPRSYSPTLTRDLARLGGGNVEEGERQANTNFVSQKAEAFDNFVPSTVGAHSHFPDTSKSSHADVPLDHVRRTHSKQP